jgi:protein-tyrosine phosphatase
MQFFKNIFKKEAVIVADFTDVGTDIHSHLIPGIDDGSQSINDTITLIKTQYALGIRKFITTPHIMSDFYKNTPEIILGGLEEVRHVLKQEALDVEINAAAEYYIDDGFIQKLETQPLLTFGDNYLLVEISYINCPDNIFDIFFKIQLQGYKVVLAHPERYPYWYKNFEMYKNIRDRGILLQLNINSITGYYGGGAKVTAERLIDQGLIDLIGSDMHHTKHAEAMQRVCYEKYFAKVLQLNLLNRHI